MTDQTMLAATLAGLDCDPEWLCSQLESWPRLVNPSRPTNPEHLMGNAAILLRAFLSAPAPVSDYKVPTGDFRCHNCKHVVENVVVAPHRCPECRCRDFAAVAPPKLLTA